MQFLKHIALIASISLVSCTPKNAPPSITEMPDRSRNQSYTLNPNLLTGISLPQRILLAGTDGTVLGLETSLAPNKMPTLETLQPKGVSQKITALIQNGGDKNQTPAKAIKILAVGEKGLLLTSKNSGKDWQILNSQSNDDFVSASYHSAQQQWLALTNTGTVLILDDDFKNIQKISLPNTLTPRKIIYANSNQMLFITTTQGALLSSQDSLNWRTSLQIDKAQINDVISTPRGTQLLLSSDGFIQRTTDNAQTWQKILLKDGAFLSGSIIDPTNNHVIIFTSTGEIFLSKDDGLQWTLTAELGNYINQGLYSAEKNTLLVVGNKGLLAASQTGGKTWFQKASNTYANIEGVTANTQQGIIAFGQGGLLLQSQDGGNQWQILQTAITHFIQDVMFLANNTLIAVGSNGLLLQSLNGGNSWHKVDSEITANDFLMALIYDDVSQSLITAGPPGSIFQSYNNGASWHTRLTLKDPSIGYFHALISNHKGTLVAVAGPGINYYSNDGGKNWHAATMADNKQLFHGSYNKTHDVFIAAGQEGCVQISKDGIQWSRVDIQTTLNFQTTFSHGERLFVAGQNGAMIYSDDGGNYWQQAKTSTTGNIQHITATPTGALIATGLKGLLLRSSDNGENWQIIYSTLHDNFRKVIIDAHKARLYLTTRAGDILFSDDDGKNWHLQTKVSSSSIKGLALNADSNSAIAYGERIVYLKLNSH